MIKNDRLTCYYYYIFKAQYFMIKNDRLTCYYYYIFKAQYFWFGEKNKFFEDLPYYMKMDNILDSIIVCFRVGRILVQLLHLTISIPIHLHQHIGYRHWYFQFSAICSISYNFVDNSPIYKRLDMSRKKRIVLQQENWGVWCRTEAWGVWCRTEAWGVRC